MNRPAIVRSHRLAIGLAITLAGPGSTAIAGTPRGYEGTRAAGWNTDTQAEHTAEPRAAEPSAPEPGEVAVRVPAPRVSGSTKVTRIQVAVGLAPEAPGNKAEREALDRLERSARVSAVPPTTVRRLRPGAGDARSICRDRRDDMVVLIGYVPQREDAVVLPYDCRLDVALGLRALAAADEDGLIAALWAERVELQRNGLAERRRIGRLSPRARGGIVAGVAIIVIGVAVGLLVANALRDEKVVVKVSP